jgi:hypothetical protein
MCDILGWLGLAGFFDDEMEEEDANDEDEIPADEQDDDPDWPEDPDS